LKLQAVPLNCELEIDYSQVQGERILPFKFELDVRTRL
jgi:hypothetical protein